MEKNLPEDVENEEVLPEAEGTSSETTSDGDWQWDAAVPETSTDNISFDDLVGVKEMAREDVEDLPAAMVYRALEKNISEKTAEEETAETVVRTAEEPVSEEPAEEETEENESEEEADSDDDGLCIVCGNIRGDSPSDLYCNECREKFLRTDYGVGHIILAFVMVIVAAVGYFVCASTLSISSNVDKAEKLIAEKKYDSAVNTCAEISEDVSKINSGVNAVFSSVNQNYTAVDWFSEGNKTKMLILDAYADVVTTSGSEHETFVNTVETTFVNKKNEFDRSKLEATGNEKVIKTYDFCRELIDSSTEYITGLQEFVSYAEDSSVVMDFDKATAYIDSLDAKTPAEKCMADYCRFLAAYYAKKDNNTIFGSYESIFENAGEFEYIFWQTYMDACFEKEAYDKLLPVAEKSIARNNNDTNAYYYMIQANMFTGNLDAADKACEAMKQGNPDGLDYYGIKAAILRRQGKFEESVKICKEGITEGQDAEIYRQQAVSYMLLDKKEEALEAVKQAYELELQNVYSDTGDYVSLEILNTAALIACLCDDNETYQEIADLFESQSVSLEKSVLDCIKGDITFEQIFMEGKGEV